MNKKVIPNKEQLHESMANINTSVVTGITGMIRMAHVITGNTNNG